MTKQRRRRALIQRILIALVVIGAAGGLYWQPAAETLPTEQLSALQVERLRELAQTVVHLRHVLVADEQIALSEKQLALARARFEAGTVAPHTGRQIDRDELTRTVYRVRRGDTLSSIAHHYGVPADGIMASS